MVDLTQLNILESYLKEHGYHYLRQPRDNMMLAGTGIDWGEQIIVFDDEHGGAWDAICGYGSYGYRLGLLEIMGSRVVREEDEDGVVGYLTAQDVIDRLEGK